MKIKEFNELTQSQPDTQNTGMAQNQLLKIGQHAIKIENMIAGNQEISEWASNKINLASDYVKKIHNTLSEFNNPRENPNVQPKTTMDPKELGDRIEKAKNKAYRKPDPIDITKLWTKEKPATETGAMSSADVDRIRNQRFTTKQIKQAYRVLNHPSVKGGNYTAAYNIINRIAPGLADHPDVANALRRANESVSEDAGTSPLKETAKMAIELIEILKNGGNIDESTQNILNQAADNLHGVYNYESYAKTNPYREELDSDTLNKHAGVIQKGIDNILATETPIDDIDTKPGMLRILNKKVNEVEKELAKEARENMTYEDMLQNKLDKSMQEYDSPEKKAERDALMKKYLAKGGKVEKVPTVKTAYKNK